MNKLDLTNPSRQSLAGVAVIFFKNLRIAFNILVSIVALQFGTEISFWGLGLFEIAIIIALIFLVISYLQYLRFFFYVKQDKFILEKGLLSRDRITIPFDRIQTVNISQNLIQQLLGVMAVKIDTAGSAEKELEIPALPGSYARELQQYLIKRKSSESLEEQEAQKEISLDEDTSRKLLVHLKIRDLLKVGITENHLRTGIIVFAVVNGYIWQYEEYLLSPFEPFIEEQANAMMASWLILLPLALIGFLLISVVISMLQTVLKFYNLQFFTDEKGVQLISGLLKRTEYQIPQNKIQYLLWKSNPLRKIIGLKTLIIKQASPKEAAGSKNIIRVPGCYVDDIDYLVETFYPEHFESSSTIFRPHDYMLVRLTLFIGILPSLFITALGWFGWIFSLGALIYLPLAIAYVRRYYRSISMHINGETLFIKSGWLFTRRVIISLHKLQNIKLKQSYFQKRRGLASLTFFTAAGAESVRHLDYNEALEIYNYTLYKIESSELSWM